jgi:hypothetical protein
MTGSLIGSLRVSLGLDSAQFQSGVKKSQSDLASFGKKAGIAFAAVSAAALAVGAAVGVAVKRSIDHADALSKNAQKAGVTTEALSRLAYAADFSDVSMEGLTGGLQKLSRAMADAATTKTSTAATAFKALGISVTDASGKLRSGDAAFAEISDRFARMETGATKTALAMQIFGKSGAELIPLLNGGSAELKRLADEADRLGITLSTKTGRDAERFNDTLTLVGKVMQGVVNQVMEAALPALQSLAQTLASPEFAQAARVMAESIMVGLNAVLQVITHVVNGIHSIIDGMNALDQRGRSTLETQRQVLVDSMTKPAGFGGTFDGQFNQDKVKGEIAAIDAELRRRATDELRSKLTIEVGAGKTPPIFDPIITGASTAKKSLIDLTENVGKFTDSGKEMAAAVGDTLGSAFSRFADAVLSGNDALGSMIDIIGDLGKHLVSSAISGFFGNLFSGALAGGGGFGGGNIGRAVYGGNGGFFPGFPGFASGTNFAPGGPAWVGENGPELVNLPRGSQVIPNHDLRGHGGITQIFHIDAKGAEIGVEQKIVRAIQTMVPPMINNNAPAAVALARRNKVGG